MSHPAPWAAPAPSLTGPYRPWSSYGLSGAGSALRGWLRGPESAATVQRRSTCCCLHARQQLQVALRSASFEINGDSAIDIAHLFAMLQVDLLRFGRNQGVEAGDARGRLKEQRVY